jgi:hypothetical protein
MPRPTEPGWYWVQNTPWRTSELAKQRDDLGHDTPRAGGLEDRLANGGLLVEIVREQYGEFLEVRGLFDSRRRLASFTEGHFLWGTRVPDEFMKPME